MEFTMEQTDLTEQTEQINMPTLDDLQQLLGNCNIYGITGKDGASDSDNNDDNAVPTFDDIKMLEQEMSLMSLLDLPPVKASSARRMRKNMTSYWGVELRNEIFNNVTISNILKEYPSLVPLDRLHCTLLYVGKKECDNEKVFVPFERRVCKVFVDAVAYSEDALVLRVKRVTYKEGDNILDMQHFQDQLHVSLAVNKSKGVQTKNSVDAFASGTITEFDTEIVLTGKVKRFVF
jgi:hypothetical protein